MNRSDVRRWATTTPLPWKNGGGKTRELFSSVNDAGFDWRISIADVDNSGPFSVFEGIDRTIVLLEGPAMSLTVAGGAHELTRFRPFSFDGGADVFCEVALGPTRDLNVMTRRDRCRARVEIIELDGTAVRVASGETEMVTVLCGQGSFAGEGFASITLDKFDVLRLPEGRMSIGAVQLRGAGTLAWIEITAQASPL